MQKLGEPVEEWLGSRRFVRILRRMRVNQIESKPSEKQFANEARTGPLTFTGRLGDIARFFLGGKSRRML
jgi:hypothetical protein